MPRILERLNQCFLWSFPLVGIALVARMFPEFRVMKRGASQTL
jgi:hypothetical protein